MPHTQTLDRDKVWRDFKDVVNMTPSELETWLGTDESRSAGWTASGEGETVGHNSGRRIVEIKGKSKASLTDDDYHHMQKVVGYVNRHMAQGGPERDKENSRWRHSLMNWGHDPMKE